MTYHVCDCGIRYDSFAGVELCQGRRHAGSAELEELMALSDLDSEERALAEATRTHVRSKYRVNPEPAPEASE